MGRAPCCDKANVKKGPWSPEEDAKLKSYIDQHGTGGNWIALPQKIGLKRCGKSCRLRWLNYLRPNIKHGGFSEEEDNIICSLYISIGSRWSIIAAQLPGRTDNDIKNYWNTRLKKKLLGKQRREKNSTRGGGKQNADALITMAAPPPPPPVLQPVPYSDEEPRFNNHASIRRLLIKLGGRFSSQDQYNQHDMIKFDNHHHHDQHSYPTVDDQTLVQVQPMNINPIDQLIGSSDQINHLVNGATNAPHFDLVGTETSFSIMPKASMVCENQERVVQMQGLEFFYDDLMNRSAWGGMNPWGFGPSSSSSDQGFVEEGTSVSPSEEFNVDKMRYIGT